MSFKITLELSGEQRVFQSLDRYQGKMRNMRPAFERMFQSFLRFERRLFDTEGTTGASGRWVALKPATIKRKAAKGQDPRILHATQRLRRSLTNKSHSDNIQEMKAYSFRFGTSVPYADYHQNPKTTSRLPKREVVSMTASQNAAFTRAIRDHIMSDSS